MMATLWTVPARLGRRLQEATLREGDAPPPDSAETESSGSPEPAPEPDAYASWIAAFEPAPSIQLGDRPLPRIALLMPAAADDGATAATAMAATIDSLLGQTYADWLLVAPNMPALQQIATARGDDPRLCLLSCAAGSSRAGLLAGLLAGAETNWVGVIDSGDVLAPGALQAVASTLASDSGLALVYGDEDVIDAMGRRAKPFFKPAWSPELLYAFNYFGRLTVFARAQAEAVGGFSAAEGDGAEWGLHLRLGDAITAAGLRIGRLPAVLCHRPEASHQERPGPGTQAAVERQRVLHDYWARQGRPDVRVSTEADGTQRVRGQVSPAPLVSIIVPVHKRMDRLRLCLKGILERTEYRAIELVVVGSAADDPATALLFDELRQVDPVRVVDLPEPVTPYAAFNAGVRSARGSFLVFLQGDLDIRDSDWLDEMVLIGSRPGVGVVGAKLVASDGALLHAGIAAGPGLLGDMFHGGEETGFGVFGAPDHTRNWSAVSGGCQMVRLDVFEQVGGFDERFLSAYADIVFCVQAGRLGHRTAFTPFAVVTRPSDVPEPQAPAEDKARAARALQRLGMGDDPFFHPGLSCGNPLPVLRAPDEPSPFEAARHQAAQWLAAVPNFGRPFDLFDDSVVLAATKMPRIHVLPVFDSLRPVKGAWDAARWVIGLLRYRSDLRVRFPHALTEGREGAFAVWLAEGTGGEIPLPQGLVEYLDALWALDAAALPLQIYAWRDDVHAAFPMGMLPPGYAGLAGYLFRSGQFEYGLRLEQIWWLLLLNAENPAAELVRAYRFNIAWQVAHPLGLTIFGRSAFASWIARTYDAEPGAAWLDPASWPDLPMPAEQIRLAYAHNPTWQRTHPRAFASESQAGNLLTWLASPAGGLPADQRQWCAQAMQAGLAAALAGSAVTVLGHFCYPSGLRVSVEAMADSMQETGVAVTRRDVRTRFDSDRTHAAYGGLESADITIIHVQPGDLFLKAYERADLAERSPRSYRIGYWYWELDHVPQAWADIARNVDEIWTATDFVADAVRKVVDRPVRVLFPGVQLGNFTPCPRQALGAPAKGDGRFAFLFSFHMASIAERKNPLGLISSFRRAFRPEEPVDLVLKTTSEPHHAEELASLRAAAEGLNVTIIDRVFTLQETLALMDGCDAYVSLHRAEGLGLTMAEAMLLGKPVIATRYSGNLSFMDDSNSLLVDCTLRPLGRPLPPYDPEAQWAEPSETHAAQLMRRLVDDPETASALARRGQESAVKTLSLVTAGKQMKERLSEIRKIINDVEIP